MRILHRLSLWLHAPLDGLRALCRLPSELRQWRMQLQTQQLLIQETNDLFRELLLAIGHGPSQTPQTPRLVPPPEPPAAGPTTQPVSLDPQRVRTARDVTYSSRTFLREQDVRAEAEQRPWHRPGT